jgi:hypothetical protein
MNSLVEASQRPPLLVNYFHNTPFCVLTLALAARPPQLPLVIKFVHLILAIVVSMLLFLHSQCFGGVGLESKFRVVFARSIVQLRLDDASHNSINCLLCRPWHFICNFLGQLFP